MTTATAPTRAPQGPRLLTIKEVARVLLVSKRTIHRWLKRGTMPPPIRLSAQTIRWRAGDIYHLLEARTGKGGA
jgi:predicted DNA-binding transcriptional regulator AlpA